MQLSNHLMLLILVVLFIMATAGDIDTKEQVQKGRVLWKQQ